MENKRVETLTSIEAVIREAQRIALDRIYIPLIYRDKIKVVETESGKKLIVNNEK